MGGEKGEKKKGGYCTVSYSLCKRECIVVAGEKNWKIKLSTKTIVP